jgi:hypothetical protein
MTASLTPLLLAGNSVVVSIHFRPSASFLVKVRFGAGGHFRAIRLLRLAFELGVLAQ